MKILINALGIKASEAMTLFEKVLEELLLHTQNRYILVCNENLNINLFFNKYKNIIDIVKKVKDV